MNSLNTAATRNINKRRREGRKLDQRNIRNERANRKAARESKKRAHRASKAARLFRAANKANIKEAGNVLASLVPGSTPSEGAIAKAAQLLNNLHNPQAREALKTLASVIG